jgi:hypothetical protein
LLTFFAAAKKVSAAPHRGNANRPLRKQGKANTAGKQKRGNASRPPRKQGKANTAGKQKRGNANRPIRTQGKANAIKTNSKEPTLGALSPTL